MVTGGAGFIGSHLVRALVARGDDVTVIDNLLTGSMANLSGIEPAIRFIRLDLSQPSPELPTLLRGADCVFHLAALPSVVGSVADPLASHAHTGTSTVALLQAMHQAGAGRIVFSSSCAVYGNQQELPWRVGMTPRPASPYAAEKLAGEHYLHVFRELYGMQSIALRYFNVFGPGQPANSDYAAVIPKFVAAARQRRPPVVFGDGRQTRDFIHVDDVVKANLLAAVSPLENRVLNVASGRQTSVLDLLALLRELSPTLPDPVFEPARSGEIRDSVAECQSTAEALGFRAEVRLEDGLAALLEKR